MRDVKVAPLLNLTHHLARWTAISEADGEQDVAEEHRQNAIGFLRSIDPTLAGLGFNASRMSMNRLIGAFERADVKWKDIKGHANELAGRFHDETYMRNFFALTAWEAEFYANFRNGWEIALERFPQIIDDVEEASRCFALSRYPAAVFHSMQVLESGLIELGKFLKVKDPLSGWTAVSRALSHAIKKDRKEMTAFEKKNFAFLEQLQGTVEGLKNAWRNKISHSHGQRLVLTNKEMSEQVAQEILIATKAFMRRLAEGLPPAKGRKTGESSDAEQD